MIAADPCSGYGEEEPLVPPWCSAAVPDLALRAEVLEEIHRWCADAMTADDVPVFGSTRWCALPDGTNKTRAAVRAALAWWTEQWARADSAAEAQRRASHEVSAALDWRRAAQEARRRA